MEVIGERFMYYSCYCLVKKCINLHVLLVNRSIVVLMLCVNVVGIIVMLMFF